jgi:hypothetical protein
MTTSNKYISARINEFIDYVDSFYNIKNGIYPLFTRNEIKNGVMVYLTKMSFEDIGFDSLDRERVRQLLDPEYNLF